MGKCSYVLIQNVFTGLLLVFCISSVSAQNSQVVSEDEFLDPSQVSVKGALGEAISSSEQGRLLTLPNWNDGELIKMFGPDIRDVHNRTDWYGEHAGKWLYTTASAAKKEGNDELKALLLKTADYLISIQESDGYLGTYSKEVRITNEKASHVKSWDVWNLSYMTLGLLEVNRYFPDQKYLQSAKKIGELFLQTFGDGEQDVTAYGTRHGISSTVILDPVVELYKVTGDARYLNFAELIVDEIEKNDGLKLISSALSNTDMEKVGDGKAYQIIWNLSALAKLYEVTGNEDYLRAVTNAWQNIVDYHLTVLGGPWGGVGKHKECFNKKYFWNPYGFVETCSVMAWIQFNKQMLKLTGEAQYAAEIEKSAYNALLGAQYPNGEEWCYHAFSNGRRHAAHFNDCCPSSGALALEELAPLIYSKRENGLACNFFSASEADIILTDASTVHVLQQTTYPFDGKVELTINSSKKSSFPIFIRIPAWASSVDIKVNGKEVDKGSDIQGYCKIERTWKRKDKIEIMFPFDLKVLQKSEKAGSPQGGRDLYDVTWIALSRGPLVYAANGLIDGKDRERTFQLEGEKLETYFTLVTTPKGATGPTYQLQVPNQEKLLFLPYYEAGNRIIGTWRLTWIQNKID